MADQQPASEKLEALRRRWRLERTPQLTLQLAEEFARGGQVGRAVEVLEEGLRDHPTHLSSRVALGRYRFELGRTEDAARALESVVSSDPTHLVANKLLVRVYSRLGNAQRATDRLDLYSLLNESDPEIEELQRIVRDSAAPESEPLDLPESSTSPPSLDAVERPASPVESVAEADVLPPVKPAVEPEPLVAPEPAAVAPDAAFPSGEPFPGLWEDLEAEVYRRALSSEGIFGAGGFEPEPREEVEEPGESLGEPPGEDLEAEAEAEPEPALVEVKVEVEEPERSETPSASVTLADLYRQQGHLDRAVAVLRSVLEREPGNREALARLAALARSPAWELTAYDLLDGASFAAGGDPEERRATLLRGYLERIRGQGGRNV